MLSSEEVRRSLDEDSEGLIALGFLGAPFNRYAASQLLSRHSCWTECRYWMLISAMNRHDRECCRIYLHDWKHQDRKPKAKVSKFIPGEHYHVLNEKFDTLEAAQDYLHRRGYTFGGLVETHVYAKEGD